MSAHTAEGGTARNSRRTCNAALAILLSVAADHIAAGSQEGAVLARNGHATCVIVVDGKAIDPEKTAANELAAYLEKITGAKPSIQGEPGEGTNVFIGHSERIDNLLRQVDWDALGTDGIVMKTVGKDLVLSGGRPRGTIYAVYTFLQDIVGCRWYAIDAAEVIPRKADLEVSNLNVVYRPPFDYRQHYTAAARDPLFAVKLRQNGREWSEPIPEAFGGCCYFGSAHTLRRQFLKPDTHFQGHPDWYAYSKAEGRRTPAAICFTNKEAQEQATRELLAFLAQYPNTRIVSVSCDDSNAACQCEACEQVRAREDGESGLLLQFVNRVAEQVEKDYPKVLVSTLAYWHTDRPPKTVRPRRNVLIHFGVLDRNHKLAIPEVANYSRYLRGWEEIAEHLYVWDYDPHFANFLQPHPNHRVIARSLRFYRDHHVTGIYVQGSWGTTGEFMHLRAWVTSRLMWNPDQDERALMVEFLNGYYGAAGPYLMKYLDLIDEAVHRQPQVWLGVYDNRTNHWLTLDDLNKATRLFNESAAAVAGNKTLSYRVRRARLSIDVVWVQRYRELRRTARLEGRAFLGPKDPYAEVERIAKNEFQTDTYREWAPLSEYVAFLRKLLPPRTGTVPSECRRLKPYEWEDLQEDLMTVTPSSEGKTLVDDAKASNGKALKLTGSAQGLQAHFELPAHLEGRWRVHVVVRAQPKGAQPAALVMGVYNPNELCRVVGEFSPQQANAYRTFDLGVHKLTAGARIWVQPDGSGSYGEIETTWIDRVFLIGEER